MESVRRFPGEQRPSVSVTYPVDVLQLMREAPRSTDTFDQTTLLNYDADFA